MNKYLNKWSALALFGVAGLVLGVGASIKNFVYAAGYGSYSYPTSTPSTPPTQTQGAAVINTKVDPNLGTYLTGAKGMTLYTFANDSQGMSTCTGQCAMMWPPYKVSGTMPLLGGMGVNGTIGTITRSDGTMQLTYNGAPLYYYTKDMQPGDTFGQGFANVWSVAKP
jgi:predicted lipoprotein with Yx(FWY)xxD motif